MTAKPTSSKESAAAQPSTAKQLTAPSQEGVGQGEIASAAAPSATPETDAEIKAWNDWIAHPEYKRFDVQGRWITLCRQLERSRDEARRQLAEARELGSILYLGGTYETQGGELVKMVKIHNIGTQYETLEDESGVNRYSRRVHDAGRATGSAHDYSDPKNIKRPFAAVAINRIEVEAAEQAERQLASITQTVKEYIDRCYAAEADARELWTVLEVHAEDDCPGYGAADLVEKHRAKYGTGGRT